MKLSGLSNTFFIAAVIGFMWVPALRAQAPDGGAFPGVKAALTAQQYSAAGLDKLSPEEKTQLDAALKEYFSGASEKVAQQAASQAVDQAVKEKRVEPATFIDSHIVGTFTGWGLRTVFVLDNGQTWKPIDLNTKASFPPVENPEVFVVRDTFGYKMAIMGGTTLRVRRLK
jgi:hypothetical protein